MGNATPFPKASSVLPLLNGNRFPSSSKADFDLRLVELDDGFQQLQIDEANWPPPPPDMMTLYRDCYSLSRSD